LIVLPVIAYHPAIGARFVSPDASYILGNVGSYNSLLEYFNSLFSLETLDLQPLRDLSLWIDIKVFNSTGLNTFLISNLIVWIMSLFVAQKILHRVFPKMENLVFLGILCFSVYPLFSSTIYWSMARKHLLSYLFILCATNESLKESHSRMRVLAFYICSLLSQPIHLLWVAWYFLRIKESGEKVRPGFAGLLIVVFLLFLGANIAYYDSSSTFHSTYDTKTDNLFDLPGRILSIGHYFYQLVAPYRLAFSYNAGDVESWLGCLLLLAFVAGLFKMGPRRGALSWGLFAILPLVIVSSETMLISDTYLLAPAFGVLVIVLECIREAKIKRRLLWVPVIFIAVWTGITIGESEKWKNRVEFAKNNFLVSQNCNSAFAYTRLSFLDSEEVPGDVARFLLHSDCLSSGKYASAPFLLNELYTVLSIITYVNDELPLSEKEKLLDRFSRIHYFGAFLYAALLLETNGREEKVQDLISGIMRGSQGGETYFIPTVRRVLLPYCSKNKGLGCEGFMEKYSDRYQVLPYL